MNHPEFNDKVTFKVSCDEEKVYVNGKVTFVRVLRVLMIVDGFEYVTSECKLSYTSGACGLVDVIDFTVNKRFRDDRQTKIAEQILRCYPTRLITPEEVEISTL